MEKHIWGTYQAEIDKSITAKWYSQSNGWGCECNHCRNFLELAKTRTLPKNVIDILKFYTRTLRTEIPLGGFFHDNLFSALDAQIHEQLILSYPV